MQCSQSLNHAFLKIRFMYNLTSIAQRTSIGAVAIATHLARYARALRLIKKPARPQPCFFSNSALRGLRLVQALSRCIQLTSLAPYGLLKSLRDCSKSHNHAFLKIRFMYNLTNIKFPQHTLVCEDKFQYEVKEVDEDEMCEAPRDTFLICAKYATN